MEIPGARRWKQCSCVVEKAIAATLPARYIQARLADFSRAQTDVIVKWMGKPTDGLFMTGPTGSGKTHLAAAIIRARFELGGKASFRRAADLYAQVRASYGAFDELSETAILAGYCGVPLLVLDDLASGSLSDHERRIALEVIDRRMNNGLPTIVTTNWTCEEIGAKMDERIGSRLAAYESIAFKTRDRRKK